MIKFNRTTEYALIALRYMSRKKLKANLERSSAREIADFYGLPFEITAKTLQRLKEVHLIQSTQGAKGGYSLAQSLRGVTLAHFLEVMQGPQSVVICSVFQTTMQTPSKGHHKSLAVQASAQSLTCEHFSHCEIKPLMRTLNEKIKNFLSKIPLSDLTEYELEAPLAEPFLQEVMSLSANYSNHMSHG